MLKIGLFIGYLVSGSLGVLAQTTPPAAPPTSASTPSTPAPAAAATPASGGILGAVAAALAPSAPPADASRSNTIGPDLNKLFLCKRDISQDPDMCKRYITFFCSGYCTADGCSDCSNRNICIDVCGETGATMMSCVESNKNCPSPDQVFGNFLTPDAKASIQKYASQPGQAQFAAVPPTMPGAPGMGMPGAMPGMMPGMGMPGAMPGMMPGMGMPGMMPGMGMPGMMPGMGMPGMMPGASPTSAMGAMAGMAAMSMFSKPPAMGASSGAMGPGM